MHNLLNDLPETINHIFDVLDLIVVRLTLLGLAALGAHALLVRPADLTRRSGRRRFPS
jgi:hypothetical protein